MRFSLTFSSSFRVTTDRAAAVASLTAAGCPTSEHTFHQPLLPTLGSVPASCCCCRRVCSLTPLPFGCKRHRRGNGSEAKALSFSTAANTSHPNCHPLRSAVPASDTHICTHRRGAQERAAAVTADSSAARI